MEAFNKYFLDVIKNKYICFTGRARRKEFWMFLLFSYVIVFVLFILAGILGQIAGFLGSILSLVAGLFYLAILIPYLGVLVRRIQDTGREWWFMFIPVFNLIICFMEGTKGDNKFGPDPKAGE